MGTRRSGARARKTRRLWATTRWRNAHGGARLTLCEHERPPVTAFHRPMALGMSGVGKWTSLAKNQSEPEEHSRLTACPARAISFARAFFRGWFNNLCGFGRRLIARGSTRFGRCPTRDEAMPDAASWRAGTASSHRPHWPAPTRR